MQKAICHNLEELQKLKTLFLEKVAILITLIKLVEVQVEEMQYLLVQGRLLFHWGMMWVLVLECQVQFAEFMDLSHQLKG